MPVVSVTIGLLRTHTTIESWKAGLDNVSVYASGDDAEGVCYDDSVFDESVLIDTGGTVGLASRKLTVANAERHSGVAGSGVRIVRTIGHDYIVQINISKTTVEWIEADSNSLLNSFGATLFVGQAVDLNDKTRTVFNNNLVHAGSTSNTFLRGISSTNKPYTAMRNTVYSIVSTGVTANPTLHYGIGEDNVADIINNTVFNISGASPIVAGIRGFAFVAHRCQNNVSAGTANTGTGTADDFLDLSAPVGGQILDHNLSSDLTAIGTGSIISQAASTLFVSSVFGSEDLHLVNAALAKDAGIILGSIPAGSDLSMPNTGFPNGIDLTVNPQGTSWEIGSHEFLAADSGDIGILPMSITDDMTKLSDADVLAGWSAGDNTSSEALDPDIKVQGLNSVSSRVNGIAIPSGLHFDLGVSTDLSFKHLRFWGFTMHKVDTKALGGWRGRVSTDVGGLTNYGEWIAGGNNSVIGANQNFQSFVIDTSRPFDFTSGVPPVLTAIRSVGIVCKFLTSNGRISFFVDDLKHGTGIIVKDGTDAAPGTFSAVAANDKTNGRGSFVSAGGVFYASGSITIGNDATGGHVFKDSNFVVVWEDMPISATHNKLIFVGNANGFGEIAFGTKIGTGSGEVGIGGGLFKSLGPRFSIDAIDSALNRINFYGTTIIRASFTKLAHANAKYISCNIDDSDEIQLSGSAVMKNTNISNSVSAGLKLLANPIKANFRDNRIQNCPIGITIATTIPGGVLDLSNIKFLGNTSDLEVTGIGTITVNITDGGSIPQNIATPGGAIVTVNNFVSFDLTNVVAGSKIYVEADPGGPLADGAVIIAPTIEPTNTFTKLLNFSSNQPFRATVVVPNTAAPFYFPETFQGVILGTGFSRRLAQVLD